MRVHAVTDISKGDEITVGYFSVLHSRETRMVELQKGWGFECLCRLCLNDNEAAQESNWRRDDMILNKRRVDTIYAKLQPETIYVPDDDDLAWYPQALRKLLEYAEMDGLHIPEIGEW